MEMTMSTTHYVVRHENGASYLGRYSLTNPLGFVPFGFAYVYDTEADAEQARMTTPAARDARIVTLADARASLMSR
jgi:hypothetical protein